MKSRVFILGVGAAYASLLVVGLQVQRPEFRPWELLASESGYGFEPSRSVQMREIGDLGYVTWVEALQVPRDTTFTTDEWGLRNEPSGEWAPVVVLGDSFTVGSGVSDDETLPARLAAALGVPVYNYGMPRANSPARYYEDARFTARPPEVVVFAPNQRNLKQGAFAPSQARRAGATSDVGTWVRLADELRDAVSVIERDNGLGRVARYAVQGARYRLWNEVPGHLVGTVDGGPALLGSLEILDLIRSPDERGVHAYLQSLVLFARALEKRGTRLVFAPLPDQPQLYPELYPSGELSRAHQPPMLDVVLERARRAGLTTVDVREALQAQKVPYLYIRDDTHFGPRALDLIARHLAPAVSASRR